MLEKTLESPLDYKEIQPVHPKGKESLVTQSCLTLCDPMGCSLPGSSIHVIFQARVLEWVAISFSREEISPECSLEGLMLRLKLQSFGHLM